MQGPEIRIALVGAGNLAWNLAAALKDSPFPVLQVFSRHHASARQLSIEFPHIEACQSPEQLSSSIDLLIIASSDHGIGEIAAAYAPYIGAETAVVHTSGSIPLDVLQPLGTNIGVFYPLQTFTKGHLAHFKRIPFYLEGNEAVLEKTQPIAAYLSDHVSYLDSRGRLQLHLGAVFASNFANYMWLIAEEQMRLAGQQGLEAYEPLIRECVEKALRYGPHAAQTGPAKRGDAVTMDKHLEILSSQDPSLADLYRQISNLIQQKFQES